AFVEDLGLTTPVYTDPSLRSYGLAGLKRGVIATFSPRAVGHALRAMKAGFRQTKRQGDALQQGGGLVIQKGGRIVYTHRDNEAGDHAPLDEVRAAVASL